MAWLGRYIEKMAGRNDLPQAPSFSFAVFGGIGAGIATASIASLTNVTGMPFIMAPFGASCFLAFAAPDSPLAQPRNIVFGHLISTATGLLILTLFGPGLLPMALAVGMAVVLMQITRTGHAPAGADPLVIFATHPTWSFLAFPVLIGAVVIALIAVVFNNLRKGVRYPKYW